MQGVFCQCGKGGPHDRPATDCRRGGVPAALSYPLPAPHIHTAGGTCHASDRILLIYNGRLSACAAACTAAKGCPGPRRGADPSDYFPFSHLCTGTQGQDPGFDPLALLVDAAHARDLQLEAWVNPYRIQAGQTPALCGASPARLHPDWVRYTDTGTYLDPASADVRQYIADGVGELCARYAVDGIHFDDYFYPTTDPAFDAADYAASGSTRTQDDWRRENVNALMELCHAAARRYGVRFGAAPAGDPEQNYTLQYSDAARWLRQGTVDYLMPQLYWGQEYIKNGDASHSFAQLAAAWAALPRAAGVKLYAGLGAYRVGAGDGSDAGSEWFSGHALADQLALLARLGVQGAGLYRYGSLFANSGAPALAESEAEAIKGVWQG